MLGFAITPAAEFSSELSLAFAYTFAVLNSLQGTATKFSELVLSVCCRFVLICSTHFPEVTVSKLGSQILLCLIRVLRVARSVKLGLF